MRQGLLFAGTERGVFVSFDDGDTWQPLQLNLPVTSVRDFEIYDNDLDRGDARPRLLGDRRHQPAAPGERRRAQGRRVSLQAGRRDHTSCRAATTERRCRRTSRRRSIRRTARRSTTTCGRMPPGPVTLEILDASGRDACTLHERCGQSGAAAAGSRGRRWRRRRDSEHVALWRPTPEPFSAGAGMHRVVWAPVPRWPAVAAAEAGAADGRRWRHDASDRHVHGEAHRERTESHPDLHGSSRPARCRAIGRARNGPQHRADASKRIALLGRIPF